MTVLKRCIQGIKSAKASGATQLPEPKLHTAESGHGSVQPATLGDVLTPDTTVDTKSTEDPGPDTGQSQRCSLDQDKKAEESIIAGGSLDGELDAQEATFETSSDGCASEPSTARDVQGIHLDPGAPGYSFLLELPKLPLSPAEFTLPDWPKFIPRRVLVPTELSRCIFAHLYADAAAAATGDTATGSGTSAASDGPPNFWHCTQRIPEGVGAGTRLPEFVFSGPDIVHGQFQPNNQIGFTELDKQ